jgi:CHAT domain-containing protein/tetratricopeptide (TPR) repeat protein
MTIRVCFTLALVGASLAGKVLRAQPGPQQAEDQGRLASGGAERRQLAGTVIHHWNIAIAAGQYVQVDVLQDGTDLVLRIRDPGGTVIREVDSPTGASGTERAAWIAGAAGIWIAEIAGFEAGQSGAYEITLAAQRQALAPDSMRVEADSLLAEATQALARQTRAAFEGAIPNFQAAARLYGRLDDPRSEGSALHAVGAIHAALGRTDSALVDYRRTLPIRRDAGDRAGEAETLNAIGVVHRGRGRSDSALVYYREALTIRREVGNRRGEGETLGNIAVAHSAAGRPDSALTHYRQALPIMREVGDRRGEGLTLTNLGLVFSTLGQPDSALAHYRLALPIQRQVNDRRGVAVTLNNTALAFTNQGRPDSALAYFWESLEVRREIGDRAGEAFNLSSIGIIHRGLGQPDSALIYLRLALPIRRQVRDRSGEASTLGHIGSVYRDLGRPDSALVYYQSALAITRAVGDRRNEGGLLNNLGGLHQNADSGLAYYRQALAVHREVRDRPGEGQTLGNLGVLHGGSGRPDSALAYHRQALEISRQVGNRTGEGGTLNNIGVEFTRLGQPDSALAYLRRALAIRREVGGRLGEGITLHGLAALHFRHLKPADVPVALAYYDSAATAWSAVREHAGDDPDRVSFAEQYANLFEGWTLAWLAREEGNRQEAAVAALAASERGRARALLDLLRDSMPAGRAGADLIAEGRALARAVTGRGAAVVSYLPTADTLVAFLALPSGELLTHRHPITRDSVAALVAALRQALGVDRSTQLTQLATRGEIALEPVGAPLDAAGGGTAAAARLAQDLAGILMPPAFGQRLDQATELVLVPQGPLAMVPFAILPFGNRALDRGGLSAGRIAVRYAPSLEALRVAEAKPALDRPARGAALASALIVGDPAMPEVPAGSGEPVVLRPLPRAGEEAGWLAQRLGARWLGGQEATEAMVRSRLNPAPLVHLATHGYAFAAEAQARNSFVALAPGEGHDGLLTVEDILHDPQISLSAELVVLSACQTGLGDVKRAEGTIGLQRAFLAKGARSVLVSLWSVSDEATAELMKRFYTHWLDDPDWPGKAEALRRAQADVRARPGWEHPRFWAAFQLVGAG